MNSKFCEIRTKISGILYVFLLPARSMTEMVSAYQDSGGSVKIKRKRCKLTVQCIAVLVSPIILSVLCPNLKVLEV